MRASLNGCVHKQTVAKKKQDGHSGCLSALSSFNSGHCSSLAVLSGVVGHRRASVGSLLCATPFKISVPSNKTMLPKDAGFESESRATINDSRTVYPVLC